MSNSVQNQRYQVELELHDYQSRYQQSLAELAEAEAIERIWRKDHTLWQPDPKEVSNRLGWLTSPEKMRAVLPELEELAADLHRAGLRQAVLLGMGGSSLAPEVFRETFGVQPDRLELEVLDSTDPAAVHQLSSSLALPETLFVVASKSGTTVETLSFFKYFYNQVEQAVGSDKAGQHFLGITDPESRMVEIGERYHFRRVFTNDPDIGGRYSALSYFGLVPAALVGVNLEELIERALTAASDCKQSLAGQVNPAAALGVALAELSKAGRDKLTFAISAELSHFGNWVEQLLAESTGKEGKGILPVLAEPLGDSAVYRDDRVFVHLRLPEDSEHNERLAALSQAGHPLIRLELEDRYDLG
ncbi:MAG: glucose-6-phosphate isomerase, partial [Anaerolineales bacterium]